MAAAEVSLAAVKALFLERQHLGAPRAHRLTPARLLRFVEDAGGLQIDTINVVDRAHYLTVWSRFGPYERAALDALAHRKRRLFEYWAHAACLIATTQLEPWRRAMLDYSLRSRAWGKWLSKNRTLIAEVEAAIRERGPLGSADFDHARPAGSQAGWWNWKPTTHALDYLWMSGRTLVASRVAFQKKFDLAARVLPVDGLEPPSAAEFARWHVRRSLHAMGAATDRDLGGYLTFPRAPVARRAALAAMLRDGEVVEVAVSDAKTPGARRRRWLALAEDVAALERAGRRRHASRGTTLLSPFDSLMWHRERVSTLFGFDYRIEVYTPAHRRTFGYYTLPILHDGTLVGRIDPKIHRDERRLEVRSAHFETRVGEPPSIEAPAGDRDALLAGTADAIRSLAAFVDADRIDLGRVVPARLRAPLAARIRGA